MGFAYSSGVPTFFYLISGFWPFDIEERAWM